jgi:small subunit ribosomal protein S16
MVKIRLSRYGTKGRPFYRVVVTEASVGRSGKFVENIGVYDPVRKPKLMQVNEERALHWLMQGAQPTETAAVVLSRTGILEKYLAQRPNQRKNYKFLDKRTAAISVPSAVAAEAAPPSEPTPAVEVAPDRAAPESAAPEVVPAETAAAE